MISTLDELRIPVVKGQENLDALLMRELLGSFDELVTVDESGISSVDTINLPKINYIDELREANKKRIKKILQKVAQQCYEQFEDEYAYRGLEFLPFDEYLDLVFDIDTAILSLMSMYDEITKEPLIKMNVSHTSKFKATVSPKQALQLLLQDAKQALLFQSKDVYRAIRPTAKSIIDSGVKVAIQTEQGRSVISMKSAVDRFMLNSIDAVKSVIFNFVTEDIQPDGVEISVHFNPALDHAPLQGHQFSNEEFNKLQSGADCSDVSGVSFSGIQRAIGTYNCRHTTAPIIVGVTKQTFTQEELDTILSDNDREISVLNKEMSVREATALAQRYYKKAQQNKEASIQAGLYGDTELSQAYVRNYIKYNKQYSIINKALRKI